MSKTSKKFTHKALGLKKSKPLVFTAMSKNLFYFRMFISSYVLKQGSIPLNPFLNFDYFLLDSVERDLVREGNNNLLKRCDELWVFGSVSNGVLAEIKIAKANKMPVRYFAIKNSKIISKINIKDVLFEPEVASFRNEL